MNFSKVGQKKLKTDNDNGKSLIGDTLQNGCFLAHCHSVRFPGCFFIASFRNSVLTVQRRVEY